MRLFVFAERYDIEGLRLDICEDLFKFVCEHWTQASHLCVPFSGVVHYVYSNIDRRALLGRAIADWFAWASNTAWQARSESTDWLLEVPEFTVDLALSLDDIACNVDYDEHCIYYAEEPRYLAKLQRQN